MFFGQYNHQLDQKSRLRLPSKLKIELGDRVQVMKGTNGCLFIYSQDEFNNFSSKLADVSAFNSKAQLAIRMLLSSGTEIEEDNQGRFLLPQFLRSFAGLSKNVVFIGVGKRVELWDETIWNEYISGTTKSFDDNLAVLEELGL